MDRTDSLKIIFAFIAELGGTGAAPPAKSAVKEAPPPPPLASSLSGGGLSQLIAGCAGFEIGRAAPARAEEPAASAGFNVGGSTAACGVEKPAPAEAPPAEAFALPDSSRRALAGLANCPLLQYYSSESQRSCPNRSMLKTTKEQIMKHWPMLALSPLIAALDGAAE